VSVPGAVRTGGRVVSIGEPIVDFVCEEPASSLGAAAAFVPRVGGSLANIAIVAARFGAAAGLVGVAGEDEWGRWLRREVAAHGVAVAGFALMPERETTHAFVAVSREGEPSFAFYGGGGGMAESLAVAAERALHGPAGTLVVGTDTAIGADERRATRGAARRARSAGWTVLCDPNLRPVRWEGEEAMLEAARELVGAADVVKCNAQEARLISGLGAREPPGKAAAGMLSLGPRVAVVTCGGEGAFVATRRGDVHEPAEGAARLVDATGAGDSVAGVLAAALAGGLAVESVGRALPLAMRTAAAVVGSFGAITGLPSAESAQEALASVLRRGFGT
jgi:fructokinase